MKSVVEFGWRKIAHDLVLEPVGKRTVLIRPLFKVDMQYRYSKFTRVPRGKLEIILVKGLDLKFQNESFAPVLEFRVGSQRVLIDEQIQKSSVTWKHRLIEFETQSQWDTLDIRFFAD